MHLYNYYEDNRDMDKIIQDRLDKKELFRPDPGNLLELSEFKYFRVDLCTAKGNLIQKRLN